MIIVIEKGKYDLFFKFVFKIVRFFGFNIEDIFIYEGD